MTRTQWVHNRTDHWHEPYSHAFARTPVAMNRKRHSENKVTEIPTHSKTETERSKILYIKLPSISNHCINFLWWVLAKLVVRKVKSHCLSALDLRYSYPTKGFLDDFFLWSRCQVISFISLLIVLSTPGKLIWWNLFYAGKICFCGKRDALFAFFSKCMAFFLLP